ncbi:MAG: cupredoxin domain-containing protein [Terriglobia bacterium]
MNRLKLIAPFFIVLLALPSCVAFAQAPQGTAVHEIRMTAKKYAFTPKIINVRKGERVRLIVTALDREHGFKLAAFGIDQKLMKGVPTTIEFTADKTGTFSFSCSVFCGIGHRHMRGKLVVENH